MIAIIYKAYYIFFLHYSKNKRDVAWYSSIVAISACFMIVLLGVTHELGLLEIIDVYFQADTVLGRKNKVKLFFIFPLVALIIFVVHYLVFNRAKASKTTGLSELYPYTPTQRDKVLLWVVWIGSMVLSVTPAIIRMLMKG